MTRTDARRVVHDEGRTPVHIIVRPGESFVEAAERLLNDVSFVGTEQGQAVLDELRRLHIEQRRYSRRVEP